MMTEETGGIRSLAQLELPHAYFSPCRIKPDLILADQERGGQARQDTESAIDCLSVKNYVRGDRIDEVSAVDGMEISNSCQATPPCPSSTLIFTRWVPANSDETVQLIWPDIVSIAIPGGAVSNPYKRESPSGSSACTRY